MATTDPTAATSAATRSRTLHGHGGGRNTLARAARLAAMATSAAGIWLGTGLHPVPALLWVAPIPVLVAALGTSAWSAGLLGFGAWLLGSLNTAGYLAAMVPAPVVAVALAGPAVVFGAGAALARRAYAGGRPLCAVLALPAAWTAYELVLSRVSPHGTFGSVAYTQLTFLPLVQVTALTGWLGITFLLMLLPAGLAVGSRLALTGRRRVAAVVAAVAAAPVALTILAGALRLARAPAAGPAGATEAGTLTVGNTGESGVLVGAAADDAVLRWFGEPARADALAAIATFRDPVRSLSAAGVRLVVLPEKMVTADAVSEGDVERALATLAADAGVVLVAGVNRLGSPRRNLAWVFDPTGARVATYEKRRPVPGWEAGYERGRTALVVRAGSVPWGVAICKDMDFPRDIRRYAPARPAALLVPAWDFGDDRELHARMAILRGVENGFAVVRAADDGLSTVSDRYGRVLARAASAAASSTSAVTASAAIAPAVFPTPYARFGDWPGWAALALLAGIVLNGLRASTRGAFR